MKRKGFIVLAMVMVSVFLITSAPQAEQKFLRMFSGPEGGSWYPLGSAMMSIVEKGTGISSSNGPGGGVGNCKAVNGGRADLGWTYTHTAFNAYSGRGKFNKKSTNLRHLMSLYPGVFQVAVPKDSEVKSFSDLKDKRMGIEGYEESRWIGAEHHGAALPLRGGRSRRPAARLARAVAVPHAGLAGGARYLM